MNLYNMLLNANLLIIKVKPRFKSSLIIELLNYFSLENNYHTRFYSLKFRSDYYIRKLISFTSGLDERLIIKYFYPCIGLSKNNKDHISKTKFIKSIEKIQNSPLIISSAKVFPKDYLTYILEDQDYNILIIDNLTELLSKTKYSLKETLTQINNWAIKNKAHALIIN